MDLHLALERMGGWKYHFGVIERKSESELESDGYKGEGPFTVMCKIYFNKWLNIKYILMNGLGIFGEQGVSRVGV